MTSTGSVEHFTPFAWHGASYCTFVIGGTTLAVHVERVHEVIPARPGTPVPGSPAAVTGLVNLRGELVTTIDLRDQLGFGEVPDGSRPMSLVIRSDDGLVGLAVDRIGDVIYLDIADFQPVPDTMSPALARVVQSVCKRPSEIVLIADVDSLLELAMGPEL